MTKHDQNLLRVVRPKDDELSAFSLSAGRPGAALDGIQGQAGTERLDNAATPIQTDVVRQRTRDTVWRSTNAADINAILNHPSVFRNVAVPGIEKFDVSGVVADPRNILLMAEGGGIIFSWHEPGIYEVHTNFLKPPRGQRDGHGPRIMNACLAAYRWMFTHTDCMILLTRIPEFNRAAITFAPLLGWHFDFERKAVWPTADGPVGLSYYSLSYENWLPRSLAIAQAGRDFHSLLETEFERHGKSEAAHDDEAIHDLHVGACVEMIRGGQPEKGILLYNRWARFAGYGVIAMPSRDPLLIDIGNALLQVTDGTFKVLVCR